MDALTRNDAKRCLEQIQAELAAAELQMETGQTVLVLALVAQLRTALDELAIALLLCHLREQIATRESLSPEQIVEETRAALARFFDIL